MIRQPITKQRRIILGIISFVLCVLIYSGLSYRQHKINSKDQTIPNAYQFVEAIKTLSTTDKAGHNWIIEDLSATYSRLFMGLACGICLSFVVGILAGCSSQVEAFVIPPISFFAFLPPTAMLALYFVTFGIETKLYISMIAFGIFPSLTQSVYQAAKKDVTDFAIAKSYTLGASTAEVIIEVVIKQIMPRILEAIRISIGPAMLFLIAAEWANGDVGFGYRLKIQSRMSNMNVVYVYLLILGIIGWSMDYLLIKFRRFVCAWFGE